MFQKHLKKMMTKYDKFSWTCVIFNANVCYIWIDWLYMTSGLSECDVIHKSHSFKIASINSDLVDLSPHFYGNH